MIKELRLKNWKSFKDATLYLDPLTVLIGTNASGKSNALDALQFLNRISQGVAIFPAIAGSGASLPPLRGGLKWVCLKPESSFVIEVIISSDDENIDYLYELKVLVNGSKAEVYEEKLASLTKKRNAKKTTDHVLFYTLERSENSPSLTVTCSTKGRGRNKHIELNPASAVLSQLSNIHLESYVLTAVNTVLSNLQKIFIFNPIPHLIRDFSTLSEHLLEDGSNIAGVLAGMEPDNKSKTEEKITYYLKDLPERDIRRVWTETVDKFKTDAMIYCEEGWNIQNITEVDARGMSDGTLRYLAILVAVLTRLPGSLLVIEEVDNGLHPSRAKNLVEMLKTLGEEMKIDVLVTTHNPALLDALDKDMIPFITVAHRDEDNGFSQLTLMEDIQQLPKLMASGSIGDLASNRKLEKTLKKVK